jgi:hypothetical protein
LRAGLGGFHFLSVPCSVFSGSVASLALATLASGSWLVSSCIIHIWSKAFEARSTRVMLVLWMSLKRKIIAEFGSRQEHCGSEC